MKLNVIERSKMPFSGVLVLLTGLWDLKLFEMGTKIVLKINWQ